jgi:hypothetical protein
MTEFPNLNRFIDARTDEARLALGLVVLRAAWKEAKNLPGWQVEVYEYVYALESGKGLNRPLLPEQVEPPPEAEPE